MDNYLTTEENQGGTTQTDCFENGVLLNATGKIMFLHKNLSE